MQIDVQSGILAALLIAGISFLISLVTGIRSILAGHQIQFFRMRHRKISRGWQMLLAAVVWLVIFAAIHFFGEPLAYQFITPSPTITITRTPSLTPTITLSPTITLTPAESYTPTITNTPYMPMAVEAKFEGQLTPPPEAVFSPLVFSNIGFDDDYNPIQPDSTFTNPVGHMYGIFSYAGLAQEIQWTALWYREGKLVHYETLPWDGGSGGLGYTEWNPAPEKWQPGNYLVQIFLGTDWYISDSFTVEGEPPTSTPSPTPSNTPAPTLAPTSTPPPPTTNTPSPTNTNSTTPEE